MTDERREALVELFGEWISEVGDHDAQPVMLIYWQPPHDGWPGRYVVSAAVACDYQAAGELLHALEPGTPRCKFYSGHDRVVPPR
jgi:hypothetical protein